MSNDNKNPKNVPLFLPFDQSRSMASGTPTGEDAEATLAAMRRSMRGGTDISAAFKAVRRTLDLPATPQLNNIIVISDGENFSEEDPARRDVKKAAAPGKKN